MKINQDEQTQVHFSRLFSVCFVNYLIFQCFLVHHFESFRFDVQLEDRLETSEMKKI
jgi:hypothetical protein